MASDNGYISRMLEVEKRNGREKMIERARQWLCSLYLGRGFNETCESFEARRPDIAEFAKWLHENAD
jgi:hypothetical protein